MATYVLAASAVAGGASVIIDNTVYREEPSGLVNGANKAYTTAETMNTASLLMFRNGMLMRSGASYDYVATATNTITYNTAPESGDFILVSYVKN